MPYTGCGNRDVMQLVTSGGRLEPPNNCPGPLYGIMMQCWHPNPDERPNFSTILERLGYCSQVSHQPPLLPAPFYSYFILFRKPLLLCFTFSIQVKVETN